MATTADRIDKAAKSQRANVELPSAGAFIAAEPFSAARPDTLVVYCSDGRWHVQIEEFIRAQCSDRADVYAVPGGPAGFNLWGSTLGEAKVSEQAIRFLRDHHRLESAWLIAHEGCAYYRTKYGPLEAKYIRQRQLEDLGRARDAIRRWFPELIVNNVYAFLDAGRVAFAQLPD
jgi:hypothetical protein